MRPLATIALTGAALGASVLTPITAVAESGHGEHPGAGPALGDTADVLRTAYDDSADSDDSNDPDDAAGSDEVGEPDDSGYGDADDDPGYSDDSGSGHSDSGRSGHRPRQVSHVSEPRRTRTVGRRSATSATRNRSAPVTGRIAHSRPMSSGEEQYRNGCRKGHIVDDCAQFDVPHLLQRGINPYL